MLIFEMSVDVAQEFYRRCIERNAETREDREAILFELAREGKMNYVAETKRSMDQYIADTAKNFDVLYISPKKEDSDEAGN